MLAGAMTTARRVELDALGREAGPVAAEAAGHDALGLEGRGRGLDGDDQDVAVAEGHEVLGSGAGAALIVDQNAGQVWQRARVHHHQGHARRRGSAQPPDAPRTGPRHHAVHGGVVHGARQRAVQRADEVERIALLLGRQGHPLVEGAEEGVGEDDRERLRRQHADGVGPALGEHARDGSGR